MPRESSVVGCRLRTGRKRARRSIRKEPHRESPIRTRRPTRTAGAARRVRQAHPPARAATMSGCCSTVRRSGAVVTLPTEALAKPLAVPGFKRARRGVLQEPLWGSGDTKYRCWVNGIHVASAPAEVGTMQNCLAVTNKRCGTSFLGKFPYWPRLGFPHGHQSRMDDKWSLPHVTSAACRANLCVAVPA